VNRSLDSLKAFVAGSGSDASHRMFPGVVVFGAGKGGVGTSAAAGLVALAAARQGASVLLVDGDETVGSLHLMFGFASGVPGLGVLRRGSVEPETLLLEAAPALHLFPGGGGGIDATLAVAAAERRMLLRRVSGLYERYDLVVVDGGSRLDSVMAACSAGGGRLVGVTVTDRIAQAAVYALFKVAKGRFATLPTELLVNRAPEGAARDAHRMVQMASSSFLDTSVAFGGAIPEDEALSTALAQGGSLADLPTDTPAVVAAYGLADRLLTETGALDAPATPVLPLNPGASSRR